jgi:hypothetical protein
MVLSKQRDDWPSYLPGPRDDILALGVIGLTYGFLENIFRSVFATAANMHQYQVSAIFERLPNNHRIGVMREVLSKSTLPDILKDRVLHFGRCFEICADNRHAIMHSHSGGVYTSYSRNESGILLSKYSRAGNRLVCAASLSELRGVADTMHDVALFGSVVVTDIKIFLMHRRRDDEAAFWRFPLRDKPPLPAELNWIPEADLASRSPPESSPE